MANKLPEVECPICHLVQIWRNQTECIHRGCKWSNWFRAKVAEMFGAPRTV